MTATPKSKPRKTAAKKPAATRARRGVKGYPEAEKKAIKARVTQEMMEGRGLREICRADDMPERHTIMRWLNLDRQFMDDYTAAMLIRADQYFDEAIEIADDGTNDWVATNDPENAGYRINGEAIGRSRLRVDTRKWAAGKLNPTKYGERQTIDVNASIEVRTDDELLKELREIESRLGKAILGK